MKTTITVTALLAGGILAGAVAANALSPMSSSLVGVTSDVTTAGWGGHGPGWGGMRGGRHGGMRAILREADADGDGALTQEELDAYVAETRALGDTDGDGNLTLAEFEAAWLAVTRPRMVDAFQALDEDGDAVVTAAELDARFGNVVARFDRNDDGRLDPSDRRGRGWWRGDDDR